MHNRAKEEKSMHSNPKPMPAVVGVPMRATATLQSGLHLTATKSHHQGGMVPDYCLTPCILCNCYFVIRWKEWCSGPEIRRQSVKQSKAMRGWYVDNHVKLKLGTVLQQKKKTKGQTINNGSRQKLALFDRVFHLAPGKSSPERQTLSYILEKS